ncbi:hypothetical protein [Paraliomyxa miuraensis]|uniref:hypothetical protein n=1 Tax=Paraliomyxa miuraensis TaxID=376150 RepID=UPI0022516E92|nr:hypothetical protein [Paraliomyxa miuraensis]MCX4240205.1 hypothetical protein [Paraliomyxa miuraensis]
METLDQGLATALVLLGVAAVLYGVATLYRSVTDSKAQQQELQLEVESRARAAERVREHAARHKERDDLLLALLPAGAALVGHWLGRQGPDPLASCMGCIPKPPRPTPSPRQEEGHHRTVEIDGNQLLESLEEAGFAHWLAVQVRKATVLVEEELAHDDPNPTGMS